jgi:isopenicillin N synthase-like dioxygenase
MLNFVCPYKHSTMQFDLDSVPVVDLSKIQGCFEEISSIDYQTVATKLGNAMSGIGFAYLINHGIDLLKVHCRV